MQYVLEYGPFKEDEIISHSLSGYWSTNSTQMNANCRQLSRRKNCFPFQVQNTLCQHSELNVKMKWNFHIIPSLVYKNLFCWDKAQGLHTRRRNGPVSRLILNMWECISQLCYLLYMYNNAYHGMSFDVELFLWEGVAKETWLWIIWAHWCGNNVKEIIRFHGRGLWQ